MKKVLVSLFIIFNLFMTSCSAGAGNVTTYHNNQINNETLDSLKILDDTVLDSIKKNDADKTLEIGSETFKKNSGNIKEAIDLYEKATSLDTQGYKLPAALYATLSNKLLRPAPFLQYKNENEITNYNKKLLNNLNENYVYPQQLQNNNNIKIYGFNVEDFKEGIVPIIKYTTSVEMSNSEELKKEANDINEDVTIKYPGMKENFKFILYEAYSEPPVEPKITYKYYRTKVEQK